MLGAIAMRNYPLMPFEYKHHQSPEQQHAVIEYQELNGADARFLLAHASGSGALSFSIVNENGESAYGENYTLSDVEHYIKSTKRMAHYQVLKDGEERFVAHAPIDRINDNTLWMGGEDINYTCKEDFDKNFHAAYDYKKTITIPKKDDAPEYHTIDVKNIGMRGAMCFYLINEERILEQRKTSEFNREGLLRALQESSPVAQMKTGVYPEIGRDPAYIMMLEAAANADMFIRIDDTFTLEDGYNTSPLTLIEKQILNHSIEDLASQYDKAREDKVPYPAYLDRSIGYAQRNGDSAGRQKVMSLIEGNGIRIYDKDIDNINSGPLKPEYDGVPLAPDGFEP